MPKKRDNVRSGWYKTEKEKAALKIHNNEDCPCGKTKTILVYVKGQSDPKKVSTPKKYKHCCKGKFQFFSDADAKRLKLATKEEFLEAQKLEDQKEEVKDV